VVISGWESRYAGIALLRSDGSGKSGSCFIATADLLQETGGLTFEVCLLMPINNFRELQVWQHVMDLVVNVYQLTNDFPRDERFTLIAQTRRTAIAIPSNIAEGASRRTTPAFLNHIDIALGSEGELFTQLELSKRLGYASPARVERSLQRLSVVGRMLNGLATSLQQRLADERTSTTGPDHSPPITDH
jgi:four helix bundle protein